MTREITKAEAETLEAHIDTVVPHLNDVPSSRPGGFGKDWVRRNVTHWESRPTWVHRALATIYDYMEARHPGWSETEVEYLHATVVGNEVNAEITSEREGAIAHIDRDECVLHALIDDPQLLFGARGDVSELESYEVNWGTES